jgi:hypothetical protein
MINLANQNSTLDIFDIPNANVFDDTGDMNFYVAVKASNNNVHQLFARLDGNTRDIVGNLLAWHNKKEGFYITAIQNFLRKNNFAELYEELKSGDITKVEFKDELDKNPNKYTIAIRDLKSEEDAFLITYIVNRIGLDIKELTTGDVSEMFSVKEGQVIRALCEATTAR